MAEDARFEDGAEKALRLQAFDTDDLSVISALVQDAVLLASDMAFQRRERRLVLLINRFRWEDRAHGAERVRSLLIVEEATAVRSQGIDRDGDTVLSLLALTFEEGADGAGRVVLSFAGDGDIAVEVEALGVILKDVTRPYAAPSGQAPGHPDDAA